MFKLNSLMITTRSRAKNDKIGLLILCLVVAGIFQIGGRSFDLHKLKQKWLANETRTENKDEWEPERTLSIDLGNGNCKWTPPVDADQDRPLFMTLIAAYPGSGKRTAFMQLEGLTGVNTGDDYNLSNPDEPRKKYAFMKTSYPHHEGIWSWAGRMDQVLLMIRNPRWSIPSYHHLLHEIDYAQNWEQAYANHHRVFTERSSLEEWLAWRDLRFGAEIHWWGWFLDFWLEGGLLRDLYTHEITNIDQWNRIMKPYSYNEEELRMYQAQVPKETQPIFNLHCVQDMPGCKPVAIASFEKMMDPSTGPDEVARFAATLEGKVGLDVISEQARPCIWEELIINRKGVRSFPDRDMGGPPEEAFKFSISQMEQMIQELERVRNKYSSPEWSGNSLAVDLVVYVKKYIVENQAELATMRNNY
mmetsp:Transcript_15138/g.21597  ORF Transcript_15138/g.21597 Transcript_15138/m.21597 type:complete len:417 (-) Transcript_15138:9-1259(-)